MHSYKPVICIMTENTLNGAVIENESTPSNQSDQRVQQHWDRN